MLPAFARSSLAALRDREYAPICIISRRNLVADARILAFANEPTAAAAAVASGKFVARLTRLRRALFTRTQP